MWVVKSIYVTRGMSHRRFLEVDWLIFGIGAGIWDLDKYLFFIDL
jgi:hypothetical protein